MEFSREKYIERLSGMRWNGLVKVITGARRAGKSYLLNELYYRFLVSSGVSDRNIIRFAFDSDEDIDMLDRFAEGEPVRIRDAKMGYLINAKVFRRYLVSKINDEEQFYIFLDEIQYLENFVGTLNSYLRHRNLDLYATGSNSRFLSSDIQTEFKGRSSELHVLPLTFSEYIKGTGKEVRAGWAQYIVTGGIPLVALMEHEEDQFRYLKNLAEEIYLKDIISRNRIRKTGEMSDTFDVLASVISGMVNPANIANTFRSSCHGEISRETVIRFIGFFEEAFVLSRAQKYSIKGRKHIDSPYKIYFEDIGVRNARLNFRQIEESHIMENVIYNELRYRGFNVDVGEMKISENTGRKDRNGHDIYAPKSLEVDFVANKGRKKYYIQSALSIGSAEKENQERRSLHAIKDSFRKIIITRNDLQTTIDSEGVMTIDLFDFLLDEKSTEY